MRAALPSTPKADNYRLAAEFEPHVVCWMLWPERRDNWRDDARPAQAAFAALAASIAPFERVTIGASAGQLENARALLPPSVRIVELASDDAWMRDVAPAFVVNDSGAVRGVRFGFNAWGGLKGGLYFPWDRDALVAAKLLEIEQVERYDAPLVAEGGALATDGQGTLITTVDCLINDNRNPGLGRARIEGILHDYLAADTFIWLDHGLPGDETGGHIDNLVAFVRPGVLVLAWTDDRANPLYDIARETLERLATARDARGRRFEIHRINQPRPMTIRVEEASGIVPTAGTKARRAGDVICASYINAYVGNGVVIVPSFDDPMDMQAGGVYATLHPERKVIQMPAREIVLGGGGIHCVTHEQPLPRDSTKE